MNAISIHIAGLVDQAKVGALFNAYRQFYEQADDLNLATDFIGQRMALKQSVILLAQDDAGQPLGFCQLYPTFCSVEAVPIYTLYDLFVNPIARRLGVAKALLAKAEQVAQQNGMRRMDLSTAKTNTSAQALYESLGWLRDEVYLTYNLKVGS